MIIKDPGFLRYDPGLKDQVPKIDIPKKAEPVFMIPLSRSLRVPQNKNSVSFSNGSRLYLSLTSAESPSIPLRRSQRPTRITTFEKVSPLALSMLHRP